MDAEEDLPLKGHTRHSPPEKGEEEREGKGGGAMFLITAGTAKSAALMPTREKKAGRGE